MQAPEDLTAIARAFVDARRSWTPIPDFPGTPPTTIADAYRVQDLALAMGMRPVGGWKVGRINPPDDAILGANRLSGPIFADAIVSAGDDAPEMPVFDRGFAAAESEFVFRLKLPEDRSIPTSDEQTLAWVSEARIGIEIASSPYPAVNDDGPCVTICDHGNNAGLVLGASIAPSMWLALREVETETMVNGRSLARTTAASMLDGPLGAVRFLLANLQSRGIAPVDGWWISSGAVTGVHEVQPGDVVNARFHGIGEVCSRISAG